MSSLGEFGLIDRIRKLSSRRNTAALIGIGDDAAVLRPAASSVLLVTTDLLLEGVHFDLSYTDYYSLGWKSVAVNLSDIAAMGGTPRSCLTGLGIPRDVSSAQVLDLYRGVKDLLDKYEAELVGGDTCSSRSDFFVSVTAIGEAKRNRVIPRSGARPGDHIFVTGTLGDAAAGLELLRQAVRKQAGRRQKSFVRRRSQSEAFLVERHLRPEPRVREGIRLANARCVTAMIDVSDGLSSDLFHICEQSGVGAEIWERNIPRSAALLAAEKQLAKPCLSYALSGGEDYELLFTVPPDRVSKLGSLNLPVTEIGTIRKGSSCSITGKDGKRTAVKRTGFDHFPGVANQGT